MDEYDRPLKDYSIAIKDASTGFGSNQFEIEIDENDTLRFEMDGQNLKDTVLNNPEVYNIIKLKLSVDSTAGYFMPYPPDFIKEDFSTTNFIKKNLIYPEDAIRDSISGVAHVRFRLNERGERDHLSVIPSVSPSLDQEAIRLVNLMPKMKPIKKGNMYKVANCFIPIQFTVNDYLSSKNDSTTKTNEPVEISNSQFYLMREDIIMPEFPGGLNKMLQFIGKNLTYPKDALRRDVSAKVLVRFMIDCDGSVKDITIIQSAYPVLDAEAIRVVKLLPRWTPGKQKKDTGTYPIKTLFTLPIAFTMN